MTTRDYTANVISATKVVPDGNFKDSKASGVWDINEALDLIKGGNWPNAANINPAAFVGGLFSTDVATGTGSGALTISNGIDLSGSGGIVWNKSRSSTNNHFIFDPDLGSGAYLQPNTDAVLATGANYSFTSTGFQDTYNNISGTDQVWWTFRKQPKFFDKVTYTGNGTAGRTVAHNLGSVPGMIIVKCTSNASTLWAVYHRGMDPSAPEDYFLRLNDNASRGDYTYWNDTAPTSTVFTLNGHDDVNQSGRTYVAYLFAHNNDDGGFGEPGNQDIIKCGTYATDSSADATINLGFEPQWVMFRPYDDTSDWKIIDNIRGFVATPASGNYNKQLAANSNGAEADNDNIKITSTGFEHVSGFASKNLIYMAIRRGGMQTPTAASDVFDVKTNTSTSLQDGTELPATNIVTDFMLGGWRDGGFQPFAIPRMTAKHNYTGSTGAQGNSFFDFGHKQKQLKCTGNFESSSRSFIFWHWARARGYFDVVAYTGTGSSTTVTHNLGVAPEMTWVKRRDGSGDWTVVHKDYDSGKVQHLQATSGQFTDSDAFTVSSSVLTLPNGNVNINGSSNTYIAYLFATVANVSKVGSFTQSGATNVACGFTGDTPSFILFKRIDANSGNWYLFDSLRGIVTGNDPHTFINNSTTEVTNADVVDPYSGGFATTSSLTDGDYIFYAIAAIS